jgi:hypothetical protein
LIVSPIFEEAVIGSVIVVADALFKIYAFPATAVCVVPETKILTRSGFQTIKDL